MTLTDLIAAIEAAPQDDCSLDWEIWRQIMPAHYVSALDTPPHYTRSVDAALTLIPPGPTPSGRDYELMRFTENDRRDGSPVTRYEAIIYRDRFDDDDKRVVSNPCATPALALCAAALCARTP